MMRLAFLALLALAPIPAGAQSIALMGAGGSNKGAALPAFTGMGDIVPTWTAAWTIGRAFSSATRGQAILNVCAPSDTTCADVSTDGTTGINTTTTIGASDCTIATCTIKIFYDKSGNGLNATQTTESLRLQYYPNGLGGHSCSFSQGTTTGYTTASGTTVSQPWSINAFSGRYGGFTTAQYIITGNSVSGSQMDFAGSANQAGFWSGSGGGFIAATAADSTMHSFLGVAHNAATSAMYVDGTPTTGSAGTGSIVSPFGLGEQSGAAGNYIQGVFCEGGIIPSDQSSHAGTLSTNQAAFY